MERRRRRTVGAAFSLALVSLAGAALADQPCDATSARARLDVLKAELQKPDSMAAMDAAKADFAADQDFDNEDNAKFLAAAAVYFKAERELDAGAVEDTCAFLDQANGLINEILAKK